MIKKNMPLCAVGVGFAVYLPLAGAEGFFEDSKASLELRNFYMSRDFREGSAQSKRQEWAQGFILRYESGYTPGVIGFGFDAIGMLGVKLDSGRGRSGTGLLPVQDDGGVPDNYSKAGGTLKVKVSDSELRVGTLLPKWPTLASNNGRLLPQTFDGAQIQIKEWKALELTGAKIQSTVYRDQSGSAGLGLNNKNRRFSGPLDGGDFNLMGVTYHAGQATDLLAQYAVLEDVYTQRFFGLTDRRKGAWGSFTSDVRLFDSDDQGQARGGPIDNRALSVMGTYKLGGNSFGLGYQKMSGDSAFPYVDGTDPYLVNFVQIGDFAEKDERSWQARYDFDLATVGIPGLTFMTRYLKGSQADVRGADSSADGERELDVELQYVLQSGSLKGLSMRLRSATYRADFARDADDVRVIVSYPLSLL
ncbi:MULTISPECIES: OprD family porin [Pseudomonas]|uniref:OprD family porin n=1 Tax=Pseudomonas TaxID=286 RepID=UPI0002A1534A|nr:MULTISPECIES: OprD family porin [Pseudomonas]AGA73497.1 porin [Pseudomonas putida HB3267]MCE0752638.1 OprD family porin [Pseudomonas asiatica]MCE0945701.1 OprD family porin [Pseudomonas asiatica]MCE0952486.1 OprD family porin [Pseudomonas asiatica]MCE1027343.1 OprD family porin [Pseudomonas asiatica]